MRKGRYRELLIEVNQLGLEVRALRVALEILGLYLQNEPGLNKRYRDRLLREAGQLEDKVSWLRGVLCDLDRGDIIKGEDHGGNQG